MLSSNVTHTWIFTSVIFCNWFGQEVQWAGQISIIEQGRQCTYKRNIEVRSRNHCCRARAICITYSGCIFVGLVTEHAKGMRLFYCDLWSVWLYRSSHIRHDFRGGGVIESKMRILIFCATSFWNIFNSKKNWERYYHKCTNIFLWSTRYSCQILKNLEFWFQTFAVTPPLCPPPPRPNGSDHFQAKPFPV